jgi:2-oxoglutarate/2-oxoacid ferredoxin oxidoreductase subunit alpha
MTSHQAIIQGAKRAGCTFAAGRPSRIIEPLLAEAAAELGPAAVARADDDVSAVGLGMVAAAAGEIALVATSSPALSTCAENIALAHLAELPIVIIHSQHLGVANENALVGDVDVTLARHVGIAGLPLPVLAAADAASACRLTQAAFALACGRRTPVILLTSNGIAMTEQAVDSPEPGSPLEPSLPSETGLPLEPSSPLELGLPPETDPNPIAIGPRLSFDSLPQPGHIQFAGRIDGRPVFLNLPPTEIEGRLKRLQDKILDATRMQEYVRPDADPDAETLLLSYGLADQPSRQAVELVRAAGGRVSHLTIYSLWPIPRQALRRAMTPFVRRVLVPEMNVGLYVDELRKVLRNVKLDSLAQFDGHPIDPQIIARQITDWPCG